MSENVLNWQLMAHTATSKPSLRSSAGSCHQISIRLVIVQRSRKKMAVTLKTVLSDFIFFWWFFFQFHAEIYFHVIKIGLDNGLALKRRQTIIWSNDCLVSCRIYASHNLWSLWYFDNRLDSIAAETTVILQSDWTTQGPISVSKLTIKHLILEAPPPCRYIVPNQMQRKYNGAGVPSVFRHQFF